MSSKIVEGIDTRPSLRTGDVRCDETLRQLLGPSKAAVTRDKDVDRILRCFFPHPVAVDWEALGTRTVISKMRPGAPEVAVGGEQDE